MSKRCPAAVYGEVSAANKSRLIGYKEADRIGDVLRFTHDPFSQLVAAFHDEHLDSRPDAWGRGQAT